MKLISTAEIVKRAHREGRVVPGFNIPYLPMVEPVVRALRDANAFGLVMVARLEWEKFESKSLEAVAEAYRKFSDPRYVRLHLDHVPAIDEDQKQVDYREIIRRAIDVGYDSVMVDGSRLSLDENIACTRSVVEIAHAAGIPVEAELGAVMGHEAGPLPPYDELFASGRGFTDPDEAARFVKESGADWLSVAIGNVHGAISAAAKQQKKIAARLHIPRLAEINNRCGIPLVLHGGTGIVREAVHEGIRNGIAKINVATAIRQPYERAIAQGVAAAQQAVYDATREVLSQELDLEQTANILNPEAFQ